MPKAIAWLPGILPVKGSAVPKEALAGLTLAIIAIPEVMGYTKIAGTPIITGIYTILAPMVVFALFGASRHLVVAADSATAAILAQGILPLAAIGSPQYMPYVCLLSLMVGVLLIACRILRFGFIARFLSRTVLVGFLTGVGLQVGFQQVGAMLGVPTAGGSAIQQVLSALGGVARANPYALAVSGFVLVAINLPARLGRRWRWLRRVPWALAALVAVVVVAYAMGLAARGVPSVGHIPGGLPGFTMPPISLTRLSGLLMTAATIVIVVITQSAATSTAYANKYNEPFNANTDLLGLGLANVAAGVTGTFVVNGSPTKTEIADEAGGRSQLTSIVAAIVAAIVLLFLTGPLQYLPDAALAALVFTIGLQLIDVKRMRLIYQQKLNEFVIAALTAVVVVVVGAAQGIIFAMVLSLIEYLRRSYHPKNSLLELTESPDGQSMWTWQPLSSHAEVRPGVMIYHFAAAIYYANANVFAQEVTQLVGVEPTLKDMLLDFSAIADVDFTGGQILADLIRRLQDQGITVGLVRAERHVLSELSRYGIVGLIGQAGIYSDMGIAVRQLTNPPTPPDERLS